MVSVRRVVAIGLTAALATTACGGDDDEAATTTTTSVSTTSTSAVPTTSSSSTTSTTTGDQRRRLTQSCTLQDRDVRIVVRYPEAWHVNTGEPVPGCTAFDPDPIDLRRGTELPRDLGVVLRVEPVAFGRASTAEGVRVEEESRTSIDGRTAVRQEVVTTGQGLGPAGQRSLRYIIDAGTDRSIIISTWDVEGNDFADDSEVLDAMATALDIEPRNG